MLPSQTSIYSLVSALAADIEAHERELRSLRECGPGDRARGAKAAALARRLALERATLAAALSRDARGQA